MEKGGRGRERRGRGRGERVLLVPSLYFIHFYLVLDESLWCGAVSIKDGPSFLGEMSLKIPL